MRLALLFVAAGLYAESPRAELERSCAGCHPLDVVEVQRLTRREWNDELRKMESLGARLRNRRALLNYLAKTYKPDSRAGKKPLK